jgi:hypothetical protein
MVKGKGAMIEVDVSRRRCLIWLASYPRSGNTWTRAIINALYHLGLDQPLAAINLDRLGGVGDNHGDYFRKYVPGPTKLADPQAIASFRPRVQADIVAMAGGGAQLVKTHNARIAYLGFPLIDESLTAGAVYIVRNPLDVCISLAHYYGQSLDQAIERMGTAGFREESDERYVYSIWGSWSENVRSWVEGAGPKTLTVRYEDLLDNPAAGVGAMARHLLMDLTPAQISRAIELASFQQLKASEKKAGFREKPSFAKEFFRAGKAGQWREALTAEQVRRVVSAHRPLMEQFAYVP